MKPGREMLRFMVVFATTDRQEIGFGGDEHDDAASTCAGSLFISRIVVISGCSGICRGCGLLCRVVVGIFSTSLPRSKLRLAIFIASRRIDDR
jgi:hypothetical protein